MSKRASGVDADAPQLERLELTPLGGGNEVGRSCLILRYKGKTIMLDCGILPSFQGMESLPWLGEISPSEVDVVFITHFHLDHAAALPYFTERLAGFRGRIFATHATIACMKLMLADSVRVSAIASEESNALYGDKEIDRCIARMEAVDFKQRMGVDGIQFMFFNAGHVLGAAMVLLEIAGVRVLYTGDYSCEEDRHLMAAEIPRQYPPDVLIVEATYGMQVHENKDEREKRFTEVVDRIVRRGGRCLIPVFALGRTQELLLILDEYWAAHPELQHIPVWFSSRLATRSLEVYRTFVSHMNTRIQAAMGDRNPWDFEFVKPLARPDSFRDDGPCVVLAAPGMLQSGFSRSLFDKWAEDPRNGVVLAGYSVEGTLARDLESNPTEVESITKRKLVRRLTVERVSFSAHADSLQTAAFVEALAPPCIILVHGERSEMRRLRDGLARKYEGGKEVQVFMPPNGATVSLEYAESRVVKAMGSLAARRLVAGTKISGVLVQRNFSYVLVSPSELPLFTPLSTHSLSQKLHVPFRGSFELLRTYVSAMYEGTAEDVETMEKGSTALPRRLLRVFCGTGGPPPASVSASSSAAGAGPSGQPRPHGAGAPSSGGSFVTALYCPPDRILLSWLASPTGDAVADSLVAVIAQTEISIAALRSSSVPCGGHSGHGASGQSVDHAGHHHHHDGEGLAPQRQQRSAALMTLTVGGGGEGGEATAAHSVGAVVSSVAASSSSASVSSSVSASVSASVSGAAQADRHGHDHGATGPAVGRSHDDATTDPAVAVRCDVGAPAIAAWEQLLMDKDSAIPPTASASAAGVPSLTLAGRMAATPDGPASAPADPSALRRIAMLDVLLEQFGSENLLYVGTHPEGVVEASGGFVFACGPEAPLGASLLRAIAALDLLAAPPCSNRSLFPEFAFAALVDELVGVLAWWAGPTAAGGAPLPSPAGVHHPRSVGRWSVHLCAPEAAARVPSSAVSRDNLASPVDMLSSDPATPPFWLQLAPPPAGSVGRAGTPEHLPEDPKLLASLQRTAALVESLFQPVL